MNTSQVRQLNPAIIALFSLMLIICTACDGVEDCEDVSLSCGSGDVKTCCTASDCYYEYDGKKYECDGTDCDDAAHQVVSENCSLVPGSEADYNRSVESILGSATILTVE